MQSFPKKKWGWTHQGSKVSLMSKLDKAFSEFIRLRDCSGGIGPAGKCITCGKWINWKDADAGHFIPRNHKATRWDERNVNFQCKGCNRFHSGEQYAHGIAIDKKYGHGVAESLRLLSRMKFKINDLWYVEKLKHYRAEVKRLKGELGL